MKKLHYYLVSGQIIFSTGDGNTGNVNVNGIITNNTKNVPARLIGKGQQILQMVFFQKLEDPTKVNVIDVPINAISYLGLMTEKEFHAPPEGQVLQEKVTADPFADDGGKPSTVVDLTAETVN